MRRTTSHTDLHDAADLAAGGSAVRALDFDRAYAELASARAEYDKYSGNPKRVPNLAAASRRLAEARTTAAAARYV